MIYIILLVLLALVSYGTVIYFDTRDTNDRIKQTKTKSTKKKHSNECYIKD